MSVFIQVITDQYITSIIFSIQLQRRQLNEDMTTTFTSSSRLSNLRQKKNSMHEDPLGSNNHGQLGEQKLKLTLPDNDEKIGYEPSSSSNFTNTRTSMRLFKGKIDRAPSNDHQDIKSANTLETQPGTQHKLTLFEEKKEDLKLVLHDSPQITDKKIAQQSVSKPPQKRIMIQKQSSTDENIKQAIKQPNPPQQQQTQQQQRQQEPVKNKKPEPLKQQSKQEKPQYINPHDEKPIIKQQDVEESKDQAENQNDLVLCPEGCGRKFNRKALQKHAKACKVVFMSKRKQFNSEAKRLTSKEQANLVKQNKLKEKNNLGKTKGKGFEKTSDNWKAASQDFRAAIKAVKKQQGAAQEEGEGDDGLLNQNEPNQAALNLVPCEFCQKMFAQVLIEKHMQNCIKKKEKEKQKEKKKGGAAVKKK